MNSLSLTRTETPDPEMEHLIQWAKSQVTTVCKAGSEERQRSLKALSPLDTFDRLPNLRSYVSTNGIYYLLVVVVTALIL